MTSEEMRERIDRELAGLRTLRDEVRVDLHLAAMDARDAWKQLEPKIAEAERLAAEVSDTSRRAIQTIADRVRAFQRTIKKG